jgi:hypothetical protein
VEWLAPWCFWINGLTVNGYLTLIGLDQSRHGRFIVSMPDVVELDGVVLLMDVRVTHRERV